MKSIYVMLAVLFFAFFTLTAVKAKQIEKITKSNYLVPDSAKVKQKKPTEKEVGIGPVKEVKLGPINASMVKEGKQIFNTKCFACHRLDTKLVGPALKPIVKNLPPVYLMNYLLNTTEMQKKDPRLKKLIKEFNGILMPDQQLTKKQARSVLEYFRAIEK